MTVEEHVPLAPYSTLHVGGSAKYFVRVSTLNGLRDALHWAQGRDVPWFILGGGANFFCRDEGFSGLVIKMENRAISFDQQELTAEAGVVTRVAVLQEVEHGLRGMEHLAGIPGTIGGAVRGNAGAFGVETKDHLSRVRVLRRSAQGEWEEDVLLFDQLFFAYRDSTFKREPQRYVIGAATFLLDAGDREEGKRLVEEDLLLRRAKQPYEFPSVGSIFKNPSPLDFARGTPVQTAGQLIEAAGLKGLRIGSAEVSTKHANFIVNRGGATATDVIRLIEEIKGRIKETRGIALEEEIVILGSAPVLLSLAT